MFFPHPYHHYHDQHCPLFFVAFGWELQNFLYPAKCYSWHWSLLSTYWVCHLLALCTRASMHLSSRSVDSEACYCHIFGHFQMCKLASCYCYSVFSGHYTQWSLLLKLVASDFVLPGSCFGQFLSGHLRVASLPCFLSACQKVLWYVASPSFGWAVLTVVESPLICEEGCLVVSDTFPEGQAPWHGGLDFHSCPGG